MPLSISDALPPRQRLAHRFGRRCLALLGVLATVCCSLTACGGGGGDSSAPPAGATDVAITNVQFTPISAQVYEGQAGDPLSPMTIRADATGNLASLNGRSLYVVVEDPDRLLTDGSVVLPVQAMGNTLILSPRQQNPQPGHYVGPFRISICLDQQCLAKLGGTPISIPYDITVLAGLKADLSNPTTLAAPPNTEVRLPFVVSLPLGVTSWTAVTVNAAQQVGLETAPGSATGFVLVGKPSPAGTYLSNVQLQAFATKPNGSMAFLTVIYGVTYVVQ